MQITDAGILVESEPGTPRANLTFPSLTALSNGDLLAAVRAGSTKESPDEQIELYRSTDCGRTWGRPERPFGRPIVDGVQGSLRVCYITEVDPNRLLAACLWVDQQSHPGKSLFNSETEGCLPMAVLLFESSDLGHTWSAPRALLVPEDIGPPSLTGPILKLADGSLAASIETNKHYEDTSRWYQRVVLFHSTDRGVTWGRPITAAQDPAARIFYWDQRAVVSPDGRLATFLWTYDHDANQYLNIHRRLSADGGRTWGTLEDLGFSDQPAHPAILPDGRVLLAWVDRFGSASIRARYASDVASPFEPDTEVEVYAHPVGESTGTDSDDAGEMLADMSIWTFGLPYAEALPDGDVLVLYYAGTNAEMDIRFARLAMP
jgi:hypothetical protein